MTHDSLKIRNQGSFDSACSNFRVSLGLIPNFSPSFSRPTTHPLFKVLLPHVGMLQYMGFPVVPRVSVLRSLEAVYHYSFARSIRKKDHAKGRLLLVLFL